MSGAAQDAHVVALAVLVRGDHVLLGHRRADKEWYADCWDVAGGHLEPGETAHDALVRECREELAVTVTTAVPVDPPPAPAHLTLHAFLVTAWEGEPRNAAPEEHDDLRWCALDDLDGLVLADDVYRTWLPSLVRRDRGSDGRTATDPVGGVARGNGSRAR